MRPANQLRNEDFNRRIIYIQTLTPKLAWRRMCIYLSCLNLGIPGNGLSVLKSGFFSLSRINWI